MDFLFCSNEKKRFNILDSLIGKGFGEARREERSRVKNGAVRGAIQKSSQGHFYPIIRP